MGLLLHAGYSVLVAADDGAVSGAGREGLYDFDTRLLSRFAYRVGGEVPTLVGATVLAPHRWQARLHAPSPARRRDIEGPALPQDALELALERAVGPGLRDEITVTNWSAVPVSTSLTIDVEPDFADIQEVGRERRQQGSIEASDGPDSRTWIYRAQAGEASLERGVRVRLRGGPFDPAGDRLSVPIELEPHAQVSFTLSIDSLVDGKWRAPMPEGSDAWLDRWRRGRTGLTSPVSVTVDAIRRAADDLGALRNDELLGGADGAWLPNAGMPGFTGLFGRDALTAGWQAALLGPEVMRGAIEAVARTQSQVDDPWRDAEPGKLIHEIRRGPLSMLDLIPQAAYYGTQTTPAMFLLCLSEHWHWTANTAFLRRHLDTALRTFEWARRYGDLDGDGFLEYQRRSSRGLKNQAWKDSNEAIRYPDGTVVENPIATVEEQAFHFLALERMAEILVAVGQPGRAEPFLEQARELRRTWNDRFWDPETGFYGLALDPAKSLVRTITSNPGHALGVGIVPPERARQVADRLMADDLFSGWGVRTLSSRHPSFNPFAYHLGTMWPVEQATFALGFKRYGLDEHADRLVSAVLAAAVASPNGRLPELTAGTERGTAAAPLNYPATNAPQAWSASATLLLLQATLGLYPFAPLGVLSVVRPQLPADIPEITLSQLRVGRASVSIRFRRRADGSASWRVLDQQGPLVVLAAGPPNAIDGLRPGERLALAALERLPGRRARAARIALGLETRPA